MWNLQRHVCWERLGSRCFAYETLGNMGRWEQYQIWVQKGGRWEMMAAFGDFEIASAVARSYSSRMRLIHATYEDSKVVAQDVLMELGATRKSGN